MNKKIICIGLVSMFLLTGVSVVSVVGMKIETKDKIDEPKPTEDTVTMWGYVCCMDGIIKRNYLPNVKVRAVATPLLPWGRTLDICYTGSDGRWEVGNIPVGINMGVRFTHDDYKYPANPYYNMRFSKAGTYGPSLVVMEEKGESDSHSQGVTRIQKSLILSMFLQNHPLIYQILQRTLKL